MSSEPNERVQKLFQQALELTVEEREAFLAMACGDDHGLADEVWSLLHHADQVPSDFLATDDVPGINLPTPPETISARTSVESLGNSLPRIEGYEILRELHRGGHT